MNDFIAASSSMQEIKRLATLMKNARVHILIIGENGVGKSRLAKEIAPNAYVLDAAKQLIVADSVKNFDEIIVENFDKLSFADFNLSSKRLVAVAKTKPRDTLCEKLFGLTVEIKPLRERSEDILPLIELFIKHAAQELALRPIDADCVKPDITDNCHSLKRSVYHELLRAGQTKQDVVDSMISFFEKRLDEPDNYYQFLDIFDEAVILANKSKFKSQLMMSKMMGINRNTLRKKMSQLGIED